MELVFMTLRLTILYHLGGKGLQNMITTDLPVMLYRKGSKMATNLLETDLLGDTLTTADLQREAQMVPMDAMASHWTNKTTA